MGVLTKIQGELKAPKSKYNSFGKYHYRSCEDILEAVKPILSKYDATMTIHDEMVEVGGRVYVKAVVTFSAGEETRVVTAFAREPDQKKGMDEAQITGTASSYARKYALNGMFLIDDTKDPDTDEYTARTRQGAAQSAKIDSVKVGVLEGLCKKAGVDKSKVLARYKLDRIEDMTETQFLSAVRSLNKTMEDKKDE